MLIGLRVLLVLWEMMQQLNAAPGMRMAEVQNSVGVPPAGTSGAYAQFGFPYSNFPPIPPPMPT